jgi:hypothetical protein
MFQFHSTFVDQKQIHRNWNSYFDMVDGIPGEQNNSN